MTFDTTALRREEKAIFALRGLYEQYGYTHYKMKKFEEYDLYVRNKDFLVSDHIITFNDTDGKLMALKPDVTLSIVKNGNDEANAIEKVYYNENVYRVSTGSDAYREIMQVGLECIGDTDDVCVWEVLSLAAGSLALISEDFVLDVSHMGIIREILDELSPSPEEQKRLLRALGEKNTHDIASVAGADRLLALIDCYGSAATVRTTLERIYPNGLSAAAEELLSLVTALEEDGFAGRVRIDFSVMSDSKYYSGIVFKGFINGISKDILSGGQYDNLMHRLGRNARAIGFAVYLDALEQFGEDEPNVIDTVLLYTADSALRDVRAAVKSLSANGGRVAAYRTLPRDTKYRKLVKLTEGGVYEANA